MDFKSKLTKSGPQMFQKKTLPCESKITHIMANSSTTVHPRVSYVMTENYTIYPNIVIIKTTQYNMVQHSRI